jgi:aromatic ring-cleaving dioxygenase
MPSNSNSPGNSGSASAVNVRLLTLSFPFHPLTIFPVPELRIYRFWEEPIGPHPIAMFEVNLFTPAQFGAFIPWLVINRGPLSALVHPNTVDSVSGEHEDEYRDHTQRATWLGQPVPLDFSMFHEMRRMKEKAAAEKKKDLVPDLNKE